MGYRIVYGADPFAQQRSRKSRLRLWTAAFGLALVILVRSFWPQGTQMMREILLPGDNAAYEQMRNDIQAGEPIGDAVTAFCRSLVEEALEEQD